jgi:hypothetical protein
LTFAETTKRRHTTAGQDPVISKVLTTGRDPANAGSYPRWHPPATAHCTSIPIYLESPPSAKIPIEQRQSADL